MSIVRVKDISMENGEISGSLASCLIYFIIQYLLVISWSTIWCYNERE